MTPEIARPSDTTAPTVSRWFTRTDVLLHFQWSEPELQAAMATLGFPEPSSMRMLTRPGRHGLPEQAGTERLWSVSDVERWARAFGDLARVTKSTCPR
jgi:hypothetical protein